MIFLSSLSLILFIFICKHLIYLFLLLICETPSLACLVKVIYSIWFRTSQCIYLNKSISHILINYLRIFLNATLIMLLFYSFLFVNLFKTNTLILIACDFLVFLNLRLVRYVQDLLIFLL